jgi:hypothetical protein
MAPLPDGAAVVDLGCGAGVRARPASPSARADMTGFEPGPEGVDGVAACYSLTHLPAEHSLGAGGGDWTGDRLGVPMFFSSIDPDVARSVLTDAGLDILHDETVTIREPDGDATFLWLLAGRGESQAASSAGEPKSRPG